MQDEQTRATDDEQFVIWSLHHAAWRTRGRRYADTFATAGRFSYREAVALVRKANAKKRIRECMIPVVALTAEKAVRLAEPAQVVMPPPAVLPPPPLVTYGTVTDVEVAKRLGVSRFTVRSWRIKNMGPRFMKFGRAVRYRLTDLDAYEQETLTGDDASREAAKRMSVRGPSSK